jgi:hypothetical protein
MTEKALQSIFLERWRPYAWIALASCLLYGHILTFSDYTYYDDYVLIARNFSHIDELKTHSIKHKEGTSGGQS